MNGQKINRYVYIISNIGSFGEDVYKIGLTRRLEPLDRVKELGEVISIKPSRVDLCLDVLMNKDTIGSILQAKVLEHFGYLVFDCLDGWEDKSNFDAFLFYGELSVLI